MALSVFAASLASVRQSVCKRARPKGISSAADSAQFVAPIEMKLGTELHLLARYLPTEFEGDWRKRSHAHTNTHTPKLFSHQNFRHENFVIKTLS